MSMDTFFNIIVCTICGTVAIGTVFAIVFLIYQLLDAILDFNKK